MTKPEQPVRNTFGSRRHRPAGVDRLPLQRLRRRTQGLSFENTESIRPKGVRGRSSTNWFAWSASSG